MHLLLAARAGHAHRQVPERDPGGLARLRDYSLTKDLLTDEALDKIRALNDLASGRGQTLAQMALAWTLRDSRVTSTLIGASSVAQLEENVGALDRLDFTDDELAEIDRHATDSGINIWASSSESWPRPARRSRPSAEPSGRWVTRRTPDRPPRRGRRP